MDATDIVIVTSRPDLMARLASRIGVVLTRRDLSWSLARVLATPRSVLKLAIVDVQTLLEPFPAPLPPMPLAPALILFAGYHTDLEGFTAAYAAGILAYPIEAITREFLALSAGSADSVVPIHQHVGSMQVRRVRACLLNRMAANPLLPSEARVFELVQRGYENQEIATELRLSVQTVKNRVRVALLKLGIRGRAEAIAAGSIGTPCAHCLFTPDDPEPRPAEIPARTSA